MENLSTCPKCGYQAKSSADPLMTAHGGTGECPVCGILVAKYRKPPENHGARARAGGVSKKIRTAGMAGSVVIVIVVSWFIYSFSPPLALVSPGDSRYGAVGESSGGAYSNYTAFSKGKYVRVRSLGQRWRWTAKARGQVRALALSTKGRYLATVALPRVVTLWEKGLVRCNRLYEFEGNIEEISAVCFSFDDRYLVALGDDDQKIDVYDIEAKRIIAAETLGDEPPGAFRLDVVIDPQTESCRIEMSPAEFEYVLDDVLYVEGIWKLKDNVSGDFVKSYNDGWKAQFEPAKSLSWNPGGRYAVCAEQDRVLIWKLCAAQQCSFKKQHR